jgi:LCP family protein required for cell wall assembly
MQLKKHQKITLAVFIVLTLSFVVVVFSAVLVRGMANSSSSKYQISLKNFPATATPFQPNAFANILEDGTIELLPQPIYTPTPVPLISQDQLPENQMNILVLGCDDIASNGFRTDVIMLLFLNPKHHSISLISFPRDLYVTIPGYWSNRINTAWGLGGMALLADTFEVNFGIHPDYYMMVNYKGFRQVIDSLDGIDVDVTQELQDSCGANASKWCVIERGIVHMDGDMALWYSRSRLTTSDFDRNRRAQEVARAIAREITAPANLVRMPVFVESALDVIEPDMSIGDMWLYIMPLIKFLKPDLAQGYTLTPNEAVGFVTDEGAMVLQPVYGAIQNILKEVFWTE